MSVPPDDPSLRRALEYASGERVGNGRRGCRKWALLLLAWTLGLVVWSIYLAAIIFLFFRFVA